MALIIKSSFFLWIRDMKKKKREAIIAMQQMMQSITYNSITLPNNHSARDIKIIKTCKPSFISLNNNMKKWEGISNRKSRGRLK
jgi:hypothetical protein